MLSVNAQLEVVICAKSLTPGEMLVLWSGFGSEKCYRTVLVWLNGALSNLIWRLLEWLATLPLWQGCWNWTISEIHSNPSHSMIVSSHLDLLSLSMKDLICLFLFHPFEDHLPILKTLQVTLLPIFTCLGLLLSRLQS